jgi:phthiocerol/phenolphthiocerol synthesis type-I polyketide synthase C
VLDMGMDSLMGMELGMAVEESFEVKLSVMTLAEGATVQSLARKIVESVVEQNDASQPQPSAAEAQVAALGAQHALDMDVHALADIAAAVRGEVQARAAVPELS